MLALAAALVAFVLRLARARGGLEWTAVALFCATVVAVLAERLGWVQVGPELTLGARGGTWPARITGDVLLVGGLLQVARSARRFGAGDAADTRKRTGRIAQAIGLPLALLGYVLRTPTALGVAGWMVTVVAWGGVSMRRPADPSPGGRP
jgi:hypothetical protein